MFPPENYDIPIIDILDGSYILPFSLYTQVMVSYGGFYLNSPKD